VQLKRAAADVIVPTLIAVVLLLAAVQLQAVRERAYPRAVDDDDVVYIQSGAALRRLTGAYNTLAADVYWIRAIQYYGGIKRRLESQSPNQPPPSARPTAPAEYASLYPLLDVTTSLDPRFNIAYRFGAIFLAEPYPAGPGRPDLAIRLLEKGLRERPDKWEYMQDIGFVHYWYRRDYETAAAWFQKASGLPGAPWWMQSLAATTLAQGGDRNSSRRMWEAIRASAEVDWLRRDAERRLMQLRALDEIDILQKRVDAVTARTGERPSDWRVLIRAGALPAIPLDPSGTVYELSEGRVRLARSSPLWPPPDEPAAMR
jgi:hypothetical protein